MNKVEEAVISLGGEIPGHPGHAFRRKEGQYYVDGRAIKQVKGLTTPHICNIDQFMEARSRLENKPTEWPDGAEWQWQNRDGSWKFGKGRKPKAQQILGYFLTDIHYPGTSSGHVFGDWRESLEARPEGAARETIINLGEFKIESVTMEWCPGRHLPPVGTRCLVTKIPEGELQYPGLYWVKNGLEVEIQAHGRSVDLDAPEGTPVAIFSTVAEPHLWHALVAECFEPAPTPADRRIEAAMKASARDAYTHSDNMMRKATIIDLENSGMLTDPGKPEEPEQ